MELAPGASVTADLTLVRPLSSGAMGSVWVAQTRQGPEVAIKFVLAKMARDRATRMRFLREAEAASQIDHPNVVRLLDHGGAHDGTPFITMELLEGEGLGEKLERERRIAVFDAAAILRQTGNALDAAHARGIIHRDIKPDNLFLVGGAVSKLKVLDFGMAKQIRHTTPAKAGGEVTATGVAVGTPDYMSPEQVLGAKDVDLRSDLWALGVVIYRCLTGRLPFSGTNPHALFFNICKGKYPALEAQGVSPALDPWFQQALAPSKKQRFGSAREMVLRFESILRAQSDALTEDESTHLIDMGHLVETASGFAETHDGIDSASTQSMAAHQPEPATLDDDASTDDDDDYATLAIDPEAARRALQEAGFDPAASAALPLVRPTERDRLESLAEHHAHRAERAPRSPLPSHPDGRSGAHPRPALPSGTGFPPRASQPSAPPVRAPLPSAPPARAALPSASSVSPGEAPSSRQSPLPSLSSAHRGPSPKTVDRGLWKVLLAAGVLASGIGAVFVLRGEDPPATASPAPPEPPPASASAPHLPASPGDRGAVAEETEAPDPPEPPDPPDPQPADAAPAPVRPKPRLRPAPLPAPPPPRPPPPRPPPPRSLPPAPPPPEPAAPPPEPAPPDPPVPAPEPPAPVAEPSPPSTTPEPAPEPAPPSEAPVVDQPDF